MIQLRNSELFHGAYSAQYSLNKVTNAAIADSAITHSDLHQSLIADLLWRTKMFYCSQ